MVNTDLILILLGYQNIYPKQNKSLWYQNDSKMIIKSHFQLFSIHFDVIMTLMFYLNI